MTLALIYLLIGTGFSYNRRLDIAADALTIGVFPAVLLWISTWPWWAFKK